MDHRDVHCAIQVLSLYHLWFSICQHLLSQTQSLLDELWTEVVEAAFVKLLQFLLIDKRTD